ncbi:hypothetical protein Avbf_02759 [Armadillidium vulgare]|nr:hypothetical protein Avbf_02759 [Armadillidium vulgare]
MGKLSKNTSVLMAFNIAFNQHLRNRKSIQRRVHRHLVNATIRHIHCVEDVEDLHITFRRRDVRNNWSVKAIRRKTTGTGRLRHLKTVYKRFKNGFRTGQPPKAKKVKGGASQ